MAESVDIRELNILIEQQSGFVNNLTAGMNRVIVGQKHLIDSPFSVMATFCWKVFPDWQRHLLSEHFHSLLMPTSHVSSSLPIFFRRMSSEQ